MTRFILELGGETCFDCPMCRYGASDNCSLDDDDRLIDDKSSRPWWCQLKPMNNTITMAEHYSKVAELMRRLSEKTNVSREYRYHSLPARVVPKEAFLELAEKCEELAEECDG